LQGSPVEIRNAAARRLVARRRYREALDVLNDAIRIDPHYAESYQNRALVFDYLGLLPQADADRRKAAELGFVEAPEPPDEPVEEEVTPPVAEEEPEPPEDAGDPPVEDELPPEVEPDTELEPADAVIAGETVEEVTEVPVRARRVEPVPRYGVPPPPKETGSGAAVARGTGTLLVIIGLIAAFGVGIYVMFSTVMGALDSDDGGENGGSATESPAPGESVTPTPEPPPDDALTGDPLSFSDLESGWDGEGITATPGDVNQEITGFAVEPVDVTLSRGSDEMPVAVLIYDSAQGISQDWTLGNKPTPKAGRSIPSGSTVWYNLNAVTIVLESNDALRQDALDGFLSVNP
jgi:hypothetical protein